MGRKSTSEKKSEGLKGKYRFRAAVRKVIINLAWMSDTMEEEKEEDALTDEERMQRAMLKAMSRRRRLSGQDFSLEEKLLFTIPPKVRTDENLDKALKIIQRIKYFQKFPEDVQRGLAENCYFLYLTENKTIFKQGQEPQTMYFILQGDVLVSEEIYDPAAKETVHKPMAVMTKGDMLGEMGLLYSGPRTNTVTTTSVVELLGLNKDDFATVLQKTLEAQWQRFRTEISRFSYFDNWDEALIREMCILGRMRSFQKDETILGDGCGSAEYAYFLLSGTCRLIQTITVEVWEEYGDTVYRLLDDPTLVPVRQLPNPSATDASAKSTIITADQMAAQDEWNLAVMRLERCIGYPPTSPQWKLARQEVERVLKKEEPFKYKAVVHSEDWDEARKRVIETLGEHTTRGVRDSQFGAQPSKRHIRSAAGGALSGAERRLNAMASGMGRTNRATFMGAPSVFMGALSQDMGHVARPHLFPLMDVSSESSRIVVTPPSQVSERESDTLAAAGGGSDSARKPLQLELMRGKRTLSIPKKGREVGFRKSGSGSLLVPTPRADSSCSSMRSISRSIIAPLSESEIHEVVKIRNEFEDPLERMAHQRRMSIASRSTIRQAWVSAVRVVTECINSCEELDLDPEDVELARTEWRRACKGVERFIKKEQVPVLYPKHRICCHFVQVCFYTPLQVFGIGESMDQRRVTAMCEVECMLLPRYWLDQHNVANVWERVRLYLNRSIPDSRAVFRSWMGERRWLRHRQNIVNELINRRYIDSGTTPYDVPYSLRLAELSDPYNLGYDRRYVIRPRPAGSLQKKSISSQTQLTPQT